MATLSNWNIFPNKRNHVHMAGIVKNHPKYPDGAMIKTSRVLYIRHRPGKKFFIAGTKNTEYMLPFKDCFMAYPEDILASFVRFGIPEDIFEEIKKETGGAG